jgi:hypothetical protein
MTIATLINRKEYTGNGVNDTFAYTFWISADGDLKVYVDSVLQTLTTNYTVTNAGEPDGGNVVFEAGFIPDDQSSVVIWRDVPKTQSTDYVGGEKFSAETHEIALDRLTVITQQIQDDMDRCIKLAKTVTDAGNVEMDLTATERASKFFGFDASGELIISQALGTWKGLWATTTAYVVGDMVYDGANGADTQSVYYCATSHTSGVWATDLSAAKWVIAIDVETVITDAETAQAAAEAAQAAAETAQSNAETAETNAETAETNAETAETNAETAETNAAASATLASQWASLVDALVAATDYSAKEWAIGTTVATGSAKDWATITGGTVDGSEYSAKEYAIGTTVPAGSAKDWAILPEDSVVDGGTGYSALHHSAKASAQRVLAETAKAAAESAQTAAETAQSNAETAETNAETAETNAETAEANAQAWAEGLFSSPASDHTAEGFKLTLTAGAALAFGNLCYVGSDGKMEKTDADAEATMPAVAICLETISENSTGEFLTEGLIRDDTWNWTPGQLIYASTAVGDITSTKPSGSGDIIQVVGVAISADVIYFKPDYAYAELA